MFVRKHYYTFCLILFGLNICSSNLLSFNEKNEKTKKNISLKSLLSKVSSSTSSTLQTSTFPSNSLSNVSFQTHSTEDILSIEDIELTTSSSNNNNISYIYDLKSNSNSKSEYEDNTTQPELTSVSTSLSSTSSDLISTLDPNLFISAVVSQINLSKPINQTVETVETAENRKTNANPSVDDIISGIIQLIGGNVKLSRPPINYKLQQINQFRPDPGLHATRINNRGPPKVSLIGPGGHHISNLVPPSVLIGPGRPAGIALPFPPSHLARLPLPLNIAPTKPPFIIPESDVSFLLGLMKPHIKDEMELIIPMKNLPKLQTTQLHEKIRDKTSTSSIINSRPIFTDKIVANPSILRDFIKSNSLYSNLFSSLSTELIAFDTITSTKSLPTITTIKSLINSSQTTTNISQLPISSFIIPSQPENPLPTGPVTDWVPLHVPQSMKTHEFSSEEPIIITMPDEPSVYELIVKHQIGPKSSTSTSNLHKTIDPTPVVLINALNTSTNNNQNELRKSIIKTTATTTMTETATTIAATITTTITSSVSTNSINASATITTNNTNMSTTEAEIVYGRPPAVNHNKPIIPSFTTNIEEIITLLGSGKMSTKMQSISSTTKNSIIPVGRPIVIPVEMDEVKPQVGGNRPNVNNRQSSGNSDSGHRSSSDSKPGQNNVKQNSGSAPTLQVGSAVTVNGDDSNDKNGILQPNGQISQTKPLIVRRPPFRPRPNVPIVRIDTCIVGDDSTCEAALNEKCLTELGLSSCQCRPGFSRNMARSPCVPVISLALSLKVDRIGDKKLLFSRNLLNSDSEDYQYLEYESLQAINSVFSLSKLTRVFLGSKVNRFYSVAGKTIVNATINLELNNATVTPSIKRYVQQELSRVIAIRNNNIGESQLWVEGSLNAIPRVEDLNECSNNDLNDCSKFAKCVNDFGTFKCECESGYEDKFANDKSKSGRFCSACSPQYCSNRGECFVVKGQRECKCKGNFIGSKCDIDAEVLGVALGGSVAALIIIIITFLCLYMWNQRWKKEQQKMEAMSAASGHTFSYVNKQAATAYRLTIDDRMRWAQIAEAMATNPGYSTNYYVNPEQMTTSQHQVNHVYATPNRVQTSGTLLNDDLCAYDSRQYTRSLRPKSRTASSTALGYTMKNSGNDSIYNETEFSTREMIYSPTHLIPAPRSQFSYS